MIIIIDPKIFWLCQKVFSGQSKVIGVQINPKFDDFIVLEKFLFLNKNCKTVWLGAIKILKPPSPVTNKTVNQQHLLKITPCDHYITPYMWSLSPKFFPFLETWALMRRGQMLFIISSKQRGEIEAARTFRMTRPDVPIL